MTFIERLAGHGWLLEFEVEQIDVTSASPTPDPFWRYVDRAGHEHHYDKGYPTLELIVDEQHWCSGNEGFFPHDPHEFVDRSHYECRQCREPIAPGQRPAYAPTWIAGQWFGQMTVTLPGGITHHFHVDHDDLEVFLHAAPEARDQLAQTIVRKPDLRIIETFIER